MPLAPPWNKNFSQNYLPPPNASPIEVPVNRRAKREKSLLTPVLGIGVRFEVNCIL